MSAGSRNDRPGGARERLAPSLIRAAMGAAADRLAALEVVATTISTNQDLLERPPGAIHRVARFAERQTGGRGRRGRAWFSPFARNVYLSLGWRLERGSADLGHLPLVAALAVARAVTAIGHRDHGVKWPNDVVTPEGKLGGCLVETRNGPDGARVAVLGVGLNVRLAGAPGVDAIDQPWADLATRLPAVSRNTVAGVLLAALVDALEAFEADGFAPFEADWARYDVLAGRRVTVSGGGITARGRCLGLGPRGGLRVQCDGVVTEHLAGEVRIRPAV